MMAKKILRPDAKGRICLGNLTKGISCSGLISKMAWLAFNDKNGLKLIDSENPLWFTLIDGENLLAQIN